MSVIAYDGKTIAADHMASYGGSQIKCDKLFQIEPHIIVGFVGEHGMGKTLVEWFTAGAKPDDYPRLQNEDAAATLIVYTKHVNGTTDPNGEPICMFYTNSSPVPLELKDHPMAWGSGGQVALGAMAAGASATKAVEIANIHAEGCGFGVSTFTFKKSKRKDA